MAHQYPSTPAYGYPPYYPSFTQDAVQQNSTPGGSYATPHAPQIGAHPSVPPSNSYSFNHNAQVQPQPGAFRFPPGFNPDMLKHLPYPPPPPPPNFASGTNTPTPFAHFQHALSSSTPPVLHPLQQTYPPFRNAITPRSDGFDDGKNGQRAHMNTFAQHVNGEEQNGPTRLQHHGMPLDGPYLNNNNFVSETEAKVLPSSAEFANRKRLQSNHDQLAEVTAQESGPRPNHDVDAYDPKEPNKGYVQPTSSRKSMSRAELKEHAKAAVLALVPHNISYANLASEGINPHVLQQLFGELGLEHEASTTVGIPRGDDSAEEITQHDSMPPPEAAPAQSLPLSAPSAVANSSAKLLAAIVRDSQNTPTATPNIERKDRIAQLLAARAGKGSTGSQPTSPKSGSESRNGSPATLVATIPSAVQLPAQPEASSFKQMFIAQQEAAKKRMARLQAEAASVKAKATDGQPMPSLRTNSNIHVTLPPTVLVTPSQLSLLPTPIRESIKAGGMSSMIPGLSLLSEDEEPIAESTEVTDTYKPDTAKSPTNMKRPRSADMNENDDEHTNTKRIALSTDSIVEEPQNAIENPADDASEGEIIEEDHGSAPLQDLETSQHASPISVHPSTKPAQLNGSAPRFVPQSATSQRDLHAEEESEVEAIEPGTTKMQEQKTQSPNDDMGDLPQPTHTRESAGGFRNTREPPSRRPWSPAASSPVPLAKMTQEQLAERSAQLKANIRRQRELRRQQLVDGMPALNDEIDQTRQRLHQAKARLEEIKATIQHNEDVVAAAREDARQTVVQIESLESKLKAGVSGQAQFSDELKDIRQQNEADQPGRPMVSGNTSMNGKVQPVTRTAFKDAVDQERPDQSQTAQPVPPSAVTATPTTAGIEAKPPTPIDMLAPSTTNSISARTGSMSDISAPAKEYGDAQDTEGEPMDQSASEGEESSRMSIDEEEHDDDAHSVVMSNNRSEDYEPEIQYHEALTVQRTGSEDYEPADQVQHIEVASEAVDEDYEPSDAVHATEVVSSLPVPPSAAPSAFHNANTVKSTLGHDGSVPDPNVGTDDLETAMELTEPNTLTKQQEIVTSSDADVPVLTGDTSSNTRFMPYQSPLSSFKSYRFHPMFNDRVKTGYRSLTYSNKIDPKLPLCKTELSGQNCTDPNCEEQHFRSMALSDDKILVQMSSANDIKDKAQRDEYLLGLKQVIAQLRLNGVKEFTAVADALSKYRRAYTESTMSI